MTLEWDPSPDSWVTGYAVHYGTSSGNYTVRVDAGNQTTVTVSNLSAGMTYYFIATAYTTNNLESLPSNEVSYTVPNGTTNQAPIVAAGADRTVTLPNGVALSGSVTDDGLPNPPGAVSATWSKVSGPGVVTFQNASLPATTATFSVAGTYVLRLTATDSAVTVSDDLVVTVSPVPPVNQAPQVAAGVDRSVTLPNAVTLNGTITDDGLPNPPGSVTVTWSKVSGPGVVTFQNASLPATTATFSVAGTYVLRVAATDSLLNSSDDLVVTVSPAPPVNQAPQVAAGADRSVTLPNGVALSGSVTDDGLPNPPGSVTVTWSKVSGPGVVTFQNASLPATTATFSVAGTYALRLAATDGLLNSSDDLVVTVSPATATNQAPQVEAGPNQKVTLPNGAVLSGSVTDDGLPASPGQVTVTWSKVVGPGEVSFQNANTLTTLATFSKEGVYTLRLTAIDGSLGASDTMAVTVSAAPQTNQPPQVAAGPDQSSTLPSGVSLGGTVTDDGLPNPPGSVTATWSKVSGPGVVAFQNASSPATTVTFSLAGTYVLRLTATDGSLAAYDDLVATISEAPSNNQPPQVEAGGHRMVLLPGGVALRGSATDDGLPAVPGGLTAAWSVVSGPGPVVFADPTAPTTIGTFFVPGNYVLRLAATDGALEAFDEVTAAVSYPNPNNPLAVQVEAESGNLVSPMTSGASQGSGNPSAATRFVFTTVPGQGTAGYGMPITATGNYVVWVRTLIPSMTNATFYIAEDGASEKAVRFSVGANETNAWRWACLYYTSGSGIESVPGGGSSPLLLPFSTGYHTITIRGGDAGVMLDKFIVMNDRNFVPPEPAVQPVSAPIMTHPVLEMGGARVSWNVTPGATYRLVYKDSLTDTQWVPASPDLVALTSTLTWLDETAAASSRRFYAIALVR